MTNIVPLFFIHMDDSYNFPSVDKKATTPGEWHLCLGVRQHTIMAATDISNKIGDVTLRSIGMYYV